MHGQHLTAVHAQTMLMMSSFACRMRTTMLWLCRWGAAPAAAATPICWQPGSATHCSSAAILLTPMQQSRSALQMRKGCCSTRAVMNILPFLAEALMLVLQLWSSSQHLWLASSAQVGSRATQSHLDATTSACLRCPQPFGRACHLVRQNPCTLCDMGVDI